MITYSIVCKACVGEIKLHAAELPIEVSLAIEMKCFTVLGTGIVNTQN